MTKKEIAKAFVTLVASGNIQEAYDKYIHSDFSHHNPFFRGDRESLMRGMRENAREFPDKILEPVHLLEDGEYVTVHSRLQLSPDTPGMALIHIFRFKGNMIIEEWEASQEMPEKSPNEHGLF